MKILKFGASWCGPCRKLTEDLKSQPLPVEVQEIDVDENEELVDRFNIYNVPCLVLVDDRDRELDRKVGAIPVNILKEWVESYD